jgi:hypothetical protein
MEEEMTAVGVSGNKQQQHHQYRCQDMLTSKENAKEQDFE